MKKYPYILFSLITVATIIIDRLTKIWIWDYFRPKHPDEIVLPVKVLGNYVSFVCVTNVGGAFGLLPQLKILFVTMGLLVPVLVLIFFKSLLQKGISWVIAAAFVFGGAIGNLIDRLLYGHVIDFIDVHFWPIFNVADIAISIGIGILLICIILEAREPEKNQEKEKGTGGQDQAADPAQENRAAGAAQQEQAGPLSENQASAGRASTSI